MKPLKIAIAGLGTVGVGVLKLLQENKTEIFERTGRDIQVVAVNARDKNKNRGVDLSNIQWVENPIDLIKTDSDVIVELMGGDGDPAYTLVKTALQNKKSVVTANKALLAKHGMELARIAEENNAHLLFESAVAGGIPIIKVIREGLSANKFEKLYGILNGTCNYILTSMEDTGRDFSDVLKEAQAKGYAEAEPSLDIDGWDAAHKLCLLTAIAFGVQPDMNALSVSGVRAITLQDIQSADELGYRIKLLGQAEIANDGRVVQKVEPCLVPKSSSLAHVHGVLNAVYTQGNHVGSSFIEGRGAGAGPTASAVVSDLQDLAWGNVLPTFGVPVGKLKPLNQMKASEKSGEFYLRLIVLDKPGVIADVAAILRDYQISIESLIQRGRDPEQPVTVVLTTHQAVRKDIDEAIQKISMLSSVSGTPLVLERLPL